MSLTRTDLQELNAGDLVEYRRDVWPEDYLIRGRLEAYEESGEGLYLFGGVFCVRQPSGYPYEVNAELWVMEAAR